MEVWTLGEASLSLEDDEDDDDELRDLDVLVFV